MLKNQNKEFLLWLFYKIINQRLERKKHKLDIKIKELELKKITTDEEH